MKIMPAITVPTIPTRQTQTSPSQWAKVASDLNSMGPGRLPGPTKTNTLINSKQYYPPLTPEMIEDGIRAGLGIF